MNGKEHGRDDCIKTFPMSLSLSLSLSLIHTHSFIPSLGPTSANTDPLSEAITDMQEEENSLFFATWPYGI